MAKKSKKLTADLHLKSTGFTLVEVVLVMVVTGIVFISIYGLYANTVKQDMESRYEIMASNLAQEGIEIVRNSRDRALLKGYDMDYYVNIGTCRPFFNGTVPNCYMTSSDEVGYSGGKFENCVGASCAAAVRTPFKRECVVSCDPLGEGSGCAKSMEVTCTVSWDSFVNPALNRSVEARSVMTSWQTE